MKVQKSIEIAAPPEKIWSYLVEPEKIMKWCITFKKFEYTSNQRSGVGTTLYVEEKASGPLMKLNFTVNEWEGDRKFAFNMTSGNFVKGYEQTWTIDPTPSGSRFTFMEQVILPFGIIGKVMELFARRSSETTVRIMLDKLKDLSEA